MLHKRKFNNLGGNSMEKKSLFNITIVLLLIMPFVTGCKKTRYFSYEATQVETIEIVYRTNEEKSIKVVDEFIKIESFLEDLSKIPFEKYREDCKCRGIYEIIITFIDGKSIKMDGYKIFKSNGEKMRYMCKTEAYNELCEKFLS